MGLTYVSGFEMSPNDFEETVKYVIRDDFTYFPGS